MNVRAILFDAVGTLIYPDPPVAQAYHAAARRLGSQRSLEEIAGRFRTAVKKHHHAPQADGSVPQTSDDLERARWRKIVYEVVDDVTDGEERLLNELWDHFAQPSSWRLFEDVAPVWEDLTRRGYTLGIASNFDSRLHVICQQLTPLAECPRVFVSSEIGYPKPAPQFYQAVQERLGLPAEEILLVGDDFNADVVAPRAAGWRATWLRREQKFRSAEWICTLRETCDRHGA